MAAEELESPMDGLYRIVAEAYRVFGGSPSRMGGIETCECCVNEETTKELNATPLREITRWQVASYEQSAYQTTEDRRYMMPRILELFTQGEDPFCYSFGQFLKWDAEGGDWHSWSRGEKSLLLDFANACFDLIFDCPMNPLPFSCGQITEVLLALDMDPIARINTRFALGDPCQVFGVSMLYRVEEERAISLDCMNLYPECEKQLTDIFYSDTAVDILTNAIEAADNVIIIEGLQYFRSLAKLHSEPHWVESKLKEPDWLQMWG
ncbi:MAG: hypothetical protein GY930_04925 [bacterium]|nr:hypothetical protein [bacterium]